VGGWDGFSSLVKQNKKAKIYFVIYIAGFFFKKNFCYEVIVKQKIYKRASNYYSNTLRRLGETPRPRPARGSWQGIDPPAAHSAGLLIIARGTCREARACSKY